MAEYAHPFMTVYPFFEGCFLQDNVSYPKAGKKDITVRKCPPTVTRSQSNREPEGCDETGDLWMDVQLCDANMSIWAEISKE